MGDADDPPAGKPFVGLSLRSDLAVAGEEPEETFPATCPDGATTNATTPITATSATTASPIRIGTFAFALRGGGESTSGSRRGTAGGVRKIRGDDDGTEEDPSSSPKAIGRPQPEQDSAPGCADSPHCRHFRCTALTSAFS
ncbi:hypothetical protein [Amycolatopsis sp. cmx-11-12]|uniref:hypothetical protein n=1 Tax=Amycolatopsis sp. cmx-11-12 TaxID=2785795 RepID=UPI0039175575